VKPYLRKENTELSWSWYHTPTVPVLRLHRQEDYEFKFILGYIKRPLPKALGLIPSVGWGGVGRVADGNTELNLSESGLNLLETQQQVEWL
jgi:hypothetical protein